MKTFLLGLLILVVGAAFYGKLCEKVFGPDDRKTPAYTKEDGVDYIPMKGWKNSLINLLNIAGTGPIFGPIQGILFGPMAFITIPIGNIIIIDDAVRVKKVILQGDLMVENGKLL